MATARLWRGWKLWERKRRRELKEQGFAPNKATCFALLERRCRNDMEKFVGRPVAKALRLQIYRTGEYDALFLLMSEVDTGIREKFASIPALVVPAP